MRVSLIGSGNVATVLGKRLYTAGHRIVQVYSRNQKHAIRLAEELGADAVNGLQSLSEDTELFLLAIPDDALHVFANESFRTDVLVAHTAGSVPANVLRPVSQNFGVMYPLQTLRKEVDAAQEIPFLISGDSELNAQRLSNLAQTISDQVHFANDEQRRKLHLAAVISNNFSNHLYSLTQEYCEQEGVAFPLLWPLISEGAERIRRFSPAQLQTGPASRNDQTTLAVHREMLHVHPRLLKLYNTFTESISAYK